MEHNQEQEFNELSLRLEEMTLQELRSTAKKNYGIPITREHSADDIRNLIKEEAKKFDFAPAAIGELKPGWSRIKVHPTQSRGKAPIFVSVNDKKFGIPQNVECDVPNKVVGVLRAARELVPNMDNDFRITGFVDNESYPFTLIESKPGPDPRPGLEVQREAKLKPKREFAEKHGYWPSDAVMVQQRQAAFMKSM
jgi:hypothetical protein